MEFTSYLTCFILLLLLLEQILYIVKKGSILGPSLTVFMGPYMGLKAQERFERDYFLFNMGLMKLSFDFLGIALRNARLAVDRLVGALGTCTKMSKTRM
ncbi:hypothetical protein JHK87_044546 [Glycine soja]|nr:hypothetical protein JHK87_044546 [Glycine soja]